MTPDAPINAGLSFYRGRLSGLRGRSSDPHLMELTFVGGAEFDRSRWEEVDRVGNLYGSSEEFTLATVGARSQASRKR